MRAVKTCGARRRLVAVPLLAALVVALAGCSVSGGGGQRTATAVFSDVGDLANGAQVQMADVPVGSVQSIALDGDKAKVTLAFDNGVRIPADVSAAIDRTTILGDQFVELDVPKNETGAAAATAPQLANGAGITHTSLVPDVEQFVAGRIGGLRRHLDDGARADHRGRRRGLHRAGGLAQGVPGRPDRRWPTATRSTPATSPRPSTASTASPRRWPRTAAPPRPR